MFSGGREKSFMGNVVAAVLCVGAFLSPAARAEIAEVGAAAAGIISSISGPVIAGIQASADKSIAATNAAATLATTQIQSDTAKYLAETQAEVALYQAETAKEINLINNNGQTERLGMQLAELRAAREDAMASEREKRRIEYEYNQQRIALAWKQADDNYKLAQATLKAQLTQAGLISGFKTQDSSSGLTVTKTLGGQRVGPTAPVFTSGGNAVVARGSNGNLLFSGALAPRSETSMRLLASIAGGSVVNRAGTRKPSSELASAPMLASGSTRLMRNRAATVSSPLTQFRAALAENPTPSIPHSRGAVSTPGGGHSAR